MKVALVHDWLTGMRGGERCLKAFVDLYPQADIYTLIHVPGATHPDIDSRVKGTSYLQNFPGVRRYYRALLPLFPSAARSIRLSGYDLVISLSHAAAKNIEVLDGAPHLSYCFTPMRYIWDQAEAYLGRLLPFSWPVVRPLRAWDQRGAQKLAGIVAISQFIAARIRAYYGLQAPVIYPPVDTSWISPRAEGEPGEAFLYAGALVPYKNPDLVVEAFTRMGLPLWVVGSGPLEKTLKAKAGPKVKFFGQVSDADLAERLRRCRALILPGVEDFGMLPVEAMAAGRPVIGLSAGGLRDTVNGLSPWQDIPADSPFPYTGVFINRDKTEPLEAFCASVYYFLDQERRFSAKSCVEMAARFSPERFRLEWQSFVDYKLNKSINLGSVVNA